MLVTTRCDRWKVLLKLFPWASRDVLYLLGGQATQDLLMPGGISCLSLSYLGVLKSWSPSLTGTLSTHGTRPLNSAGHNGAPEESGSGAWPEA